MVILRTRNKITDFFMILAWASPFNPTRRQYSRLSKVWPRIGSSAMITVCMDDWSAHVNVHGRCFNADWRYQG